MELKTIQEAIDLRESFSVPGVYNIWDTETGKLVSGINPDTGEIVILPKKEALSGQPLDTAGAPCHHAPLAALSEQPT